MKPMFNMIKTSELNTKEIYEQLKNIKFLVCDVDYTVSDFGTGNVSGNRNIRNLLGDNMADEMDRMFDLILRGHRDSKLLTDIEQREFKILMNEIEGFTPKYWCREAYLILAARKFKMDLSPSEIMAASDMYWQGVSENMQYYPDAVEFLDKAKELSIPLIWMTGSDSRTKVTRNYAGEWLIIYDPEYSRDKKMKRLAGLLQDFPGIIEIGDPIDKPSAEFYDKVFVHTKDVDFSEILAVGDSELNDLQDPKKRGCQTILIKR